MKTVIGIDIGGSTTKIVAASGGKINFPEFVRAGDPLTALYGAFGKFTVENSIKLSDIEKVYLTGVGASYLKEPIYGLPCEKVAEFDCLGRGGLFLSGLDRAIIVSMGTGTALVCARRDGENVVTSYLGGTGIGGGTLMGLSKKLLSMNSPESIIELAKHGDLDKVDLKIKDISTKDAISLHPDLTAANFGKISDSASDADIALGIINMIFETTVMLCVFAARKENIRDVVVTGNLATIPEAKPILSDLGEKFDLNFIIPENALFATAVGAARTR